ncbi:cubilin-like protein, partial [Euroglyphus maynei]
KNFDLISDTIDGHYKANQNCHFTIKKYSKKVCYLEMHFKMFDLEASQDCQYDYMEIGSAVRLCGTLNQETSRIYVFDKMEMIINFHTDSTNERKGYRIHTEQLECHGDRIIREHNHNNDNDDHHKESKEDGLQSLEQYKFEQQQQYIQQSSSSNDTQLLQQQENFLHQTSEFDPTTTIVDRKYPNSLLCSKTFRQKEFFIHSPNFPDNYPPDLDCLYMIIPYHHSVDVCKIEINFHSFELQPYDFEKNCLKSDFIDFDNKEQFCGKMPESQSRIYSLRRNETFFIHFHSDSFRTSFDKGFRLHVPPGLNICFLEVHFNEFDLQSSIDCNKDYVSFNGVKQCGSIAKNSVRLFPFYDNEFTISFFADPLISGRGFFLKIRQNECPQTTGHNNNNDYGNKRKPLTPLSLIMKDDPFSPYQIYHANQICQQTFSSTYFEFDSPNYPNYYLPSLSCVYTIQRRHSRFCKLELYFTDFDIEPSTKCAEDYLLIDNVKYCNTNPPKSIMQIPFYEPEKRIYFRSVSFRPRKGFMIQARQIDCDTLISEQKNYLGQDVKLQQPITGSSINDINNKNFIFLPSLPSICEICVTEVTGHIQSYDYPNFYPPNVNCTYRITPLPDNCMVQLRFVEFDFDYSPECNQDYLEINGIRYCGHQLKDVSMILMNKRKDDLTIRMVTSSRGAMVKPSFKGFRSSYTQLPCLDTQTPLQLPRPPPSSSISNQIPYIQPATKSIATVEKPRTSMIIQNEAIYCDQTFDDKMFEIKSPGYPYRYFDGIDCSYLIRKNSANVCRLKVTFTYFNVVGEDGNCRGDYLDIFNTRFCGVLDQHTSKEIPFLEEKLLLHFHTNQQKTANGFHLSLEQVDCIPGRPATLSNQKPITTKTTTVENQQKSMADHSVTSKTNAKKSNHRKTTMVTKNPFMYDDDEIISEFDTKATTMETVEPKVIYEDSNQSNSERIPTQQQQQRKTYPIRYYSPNITVVNDEHGEKRNKQQMVNDLYTTVRPLSQQRHLDDADEHEYITITTAPITQPYDRKNMQKLCEQTFVDKIFFELKTKDLQMTTMNGDGAICHLHVRKAKTNVCQLDIMFMKYNLNDSSCSQQYLSVDGEKICGKIHETTTKRFPFQRSELYLFINLMNIGMIDENTLEIKVRQVECATNVDHHHISIQRPNEDPFQIKGQRSMKNPFKQVSNIAQQQKSSTFDPYCDLIENEMNFHIESPNDSSTNNRCRYTIRKANDNICAIDLKFQLFHLNEEMKCEQEYLEIDSNRICGALPVGHERRYHFMPNEYEKVIYFISSKSLNNRGNFHVNVKQIDTDCDKPLPTQKPTLTMPTVCDISVGNYRGHIKSPNYPAPYGDYTKCVYRIQAIGQEYCNVKLRIQDMDIESSSTLAMDNSRGTIKCEKDWLQIDRKKLCGNKLETNECKFVFCVTIPFDDQHNNGHRMAQIRFTSDAFGNGRGFDIEYKQELCSSKEMKTTNLISPGQKGGPLFRPPQIKL